MEILTFQGDELIDVLGMIDRYTAGKLHTLRIAIDAGTLKIKPNEEMWSPPIRPTGFDSGLAG